MKEAYLPAIFGLVGALIGSISSIIVIFIQYKIKDKRERTKLVVNAALEEYKALINLAQKQRGKVTLMPLTGAIHWYSKIFELVDNNNLNAESLKKLSNENEKLMEVFKQKL